MATATSKAPAPYLDRCSDCGPAKNPEEDGPQLDKKKTTDAQAVYICPRPLDPRDPDGKKCGLVHAVNRRPHPKPKGGK